jgi:hypothetical protein
MRDTRCLSELSLHNIQAKGAKKQRSAMKLTQLKRFFAMVLILTACEFIVSNGAQAQTLPPPPLGTEEWLQNFSTLSGGPWKDIDGDKETAHPQNANIVVSCPTGAPGTTSTHCFKVIYNSSGGQSGISKQPPSNPVLATGIEGAPGSGSGGNNPSEIGWVAATSSTTNTGTDVTQQNINISANVKGTEKYTDAAVPSYAYTLSYDVYFEPGFDFAKGGKLPGLASANFDSGCTDDGSAKRQTTNWSERVMWRENGRVELYSYDQSRPSGNCGIDELVDAQPGDAAYEYPEVVPGDTKFRFKAGVWYTVTISVAVNDNNSVLYATDSAGTTLLDPLGYPIVIGGNGLVSLSVTGSDGSKGTIQYNNVALRDECDDGTSASWNGSAPVCPSPVTDTPAARVNDVFFSTFFGGNETKRLTCLNPTYPSNSPGGTNQVIYNELCASQLVAYIWPTNTWVPQTTSAADFANIAVYNGYSGLTGTPPTAPGSLTANAVDSGEIDLSWGASTASAPATLTGYKVYSNGGILLGQTSSTTFAVTNIAGVALSASTPYYFFVKAYDSTGNQSAFSPEAYTVTPTTAPSNVYPPGSVTTTVLPPGNAISVFWAPQINAVSYQVYRNGAAIGAPVPPATPCGLLPAQQSYLDTGLSPGTAYSYTVTATDASGTESAYSQASVATPSAGAASTSFTMAATPPYCTTVAAGGSVTYAVNVANAPGASLALVASNPSSSSTALDYGALYSALPSGVGATFGPITNSVSTMTVTTTSATPAGVYPLNITATNGGVTIWTQVVLTVTPAPVSPAFTISASPSSASVTPGGSTSPYAVTVTPSGGFTGVVALTASGLPTGATGTFSPSSVAISGTAPVTSSLTVSTAASTPVGSDTLTLTGTSGSMTSATTVGLAVTSPAGTPIVITPVSRTYQVGASIPNPTWIVTPSITLATPPTCSDSATSSSPEGVYNITCTGAANAGDVIYYGIGSVTISSKAVNGTLTITASNATMTAGAVLPTFAYTVSPSSSLATKPTCNPSATSSSPAGTYPIICSGAAKSKENITYVPGFLTISSN